MRLICPNCAAQYEVDASMIPDDGRDVQCSSCGHTWFQRPDAADDVFADEMGVTEPEAAAPPPNAEPEPEPETLPSTPPAPKTRTMDDATREILRQEAAREAAERRREAEQSLESQPDLGLDNPEGAETRAAAAKARLARLRETPEEATEADAAQAAVAATVAHGSRRELLPDIEEINSTLTATGDRTDPDTTENEAEEAETRRGFRLGFFTVFLALVLLILLYMFAPQLANAVPSLEPALGGYLAWANGVLDMIDGLLRSAVNMMNGTDT